MIDRRDFKDKKLQCADCGKSFVFGAGEAQFFWSKGLSEPKRCPQCRRFRKITIVRERGGEL